VQVKRGRRDRRLAQHDVNLSAMVGLVIEKMGDRHRKWIRAFPALTVAVIEGSGKDVCAGRFKESLDTRILSSARVAEAVEIVEEHRVQRGRIVSRAFESGHPDTVSKEDVIQQGVNTAERTGARTPISGIVEQGTGFEQAFIRNAIVTSEHLKIFREVHMLRLQFAAGLRICGTILPNG
jgi:hypothetical protein